MTKKQAMHLAAKRALRAMGHTISDDDENDDTPMDTPGSGSTPASKVASAVASGKNPVMIINEVYRAAEFSLLSENGVGLTKSFVMSLAIDGQTFQASGRSKRQAKVNAAQTALTELHGVVCLSPGQSGCLSVCLSQCQLCISNPVFFNL